VHVEIQKAEGKKTLDGLQSSKLPQNRNSKRAHSTLLVQETRYIKLPPFCGWYTARTLEVRYNTVIETVLSVLHTVSCHPKIACQAQSIPLAESVCLAKMMLGAISSQVASIFDTSQELSCDPLFFLVFLCEGP
jgi:hypothetical protein